jgi:septal ring-binding cell division protein DamX
MSKLAFLICLTTLLGCGGRGTSDTSLGDSVGEGNWFCEMAEDGEQWDCIQDPELARAPQPSRLPRVDTPDSAPGGTPEQPPLEQRSETLGDAASQATPAGAEPADLAVASSEPGITPSEDAQPATPRPASADNPLMDLPVDHYAVQLLAMNDAAELANFVADHQLDGTLSARVERNGELYHVLLLGVYETRELAEQASLALPPPLDAKTPWIRSVRSIQNAMLRGDTLAANSE